MIRENPPHVASQWRQVTETAKRQAGDGFAKKTRSSPQPHILGRTSLPEPRLQALEKKTGRRCGDALLATFEPEMFGRGRLHADVLH